MYQPTKDAESRTSEAKTSAANGQRLQSHASHRFLAGEHSIVEEVAWLTGAPLRGMNFKKREEDWLLVVKSYSAQRGGVVSFFSGSSPEDCLENFFYAGSHRPGVTWVEDLY